MTIRALESCLADALHNDLGEHVELDSVILLAELGNLTVASGFLFAEVV